ncbi:Uncharacterised protein [Neisseria meningitidis]|nr:Uncharacterised protein [Neisseria meningitidis]
MKPGFFGHIFLTVLSIAYPALWRMQNPPLRQDMLKPFQTAFV